MLELSRDSFHTVLEGENPTLVDFWAPWCMPCRIFAPALEELSDELDGKVDFAKLNIDDYPDVAAQYGISSIPTVILFKEGKPVTQMVGVHPKDKVLGTIKVHI